MVIEVAFSSSDEELVELIEAVAETAQDINLGQLEPEEKKEKIFYIDILVKRYMRIYQNRNNVMPSKSLFSEAINWYAANNFKEQLNLSKMVKSMMRELVLNPYERYRRKYYREALNPNPIL